MAEPRCDRSDLPIIYCAHCRGDRLDPALEAEVRSDAMVAPVRAVRGATEVVELPRPEAWTTARFEADRCPGGCGYPIKAQQRIALCGGVWVCESCATAAAGAG